MGWGRRRRGRFGWGAPYRRSPRPWRPSAPARRLRFGARFGDDTYVVDHAGDVVDETGGSGIDTIETTISYTLGADFENLVLRGSTAFSGTGNDLANVITGNGADNTLIGLGGGDTLSGRSGADTFVFGSGFGHDRITDFATEDKIRFEDGLFADFADVMAHAAQVGSAVVIGYSAGNTVTLGSYQLGNLAADDFLFA
jgi:Ca2+-binding RTX toxin-like protein